MLGIWFGIAILDALACAWASSAVARGKGLDPGLWAVLGFLLGLVGLVLVFVLPAGQGQFLRMKSPDGDVLVIRRSSRGVWGAMLTSNGQEFIDALSPSEILQIEMKGDLTDAAAAELTKRLKANS
jgi:hypothetical protein